MIIYSPRASSIIYNYLKTNYRKGYFLLPLNSCPMVPLVFMKAGVPYELIDIEKETYCIDREKVEKYISDKNCKGLLFIYTYGLENNFDVFFEMLKVKRPDFKIIEDKCLNIPTFELERASIFADLTLFSTGYGKYADIGYGGFALTHYNINYKIHYLPYFQVDLEQITHEYKKALDNNTRFYSAESDWLENDEFKLSENTYKKKIKETVNDVSKTKARLNKIYSENLPEDIFLKKVNEELLNNWRFNIKVNNKEKIIKEIIAHGLFASSHYQPLDGVFTDKNMDNSVAKQLHKSIINLFNDSYFTENKAKTITEIINHFL